MNEMIYNEAVFQEEVVKKLKEHEYRIEILIEHIASMEKEIARLNERVSIFDKPRIEKCLKDLKDME